MGTVAAKPAAAPRNMLMNRWTQESHRLECVVHWLGGGGFSDMNMRGRVAIITGGSRGLGLLMARHLRNDGARLALFARNREELMRAKEELDGAGVLAITCDVSERTQVQQAVDIVVQHFGRVDMLINNAGIIQVGPIEHMTYGDYHQAMNVHFWGALHCTEAVLPHMRRGRSGRIVNIASIGGLIPVPHLAPYSASKFALVGYSDALRAEVAKDGIRVTTVCPGLMRTGSAVNAIIKGNHEAEFAWFATLSSLPLLSINASRAARKIIEAARRGVPRLTITPQARLAAILDRLMPNTFARAMVLANRMLPAPDRLWGDEPWPGHVSRPSKLPRLVTVLGDRAARRNNELALTR
jgi:NAD(P)-dependent dehydrogenase (short-subunit alcohol dehydrogenase family)